VCSAEEQAPALEAARAITARVRDATVLGPAPLFRLRNRERAQLLLKTTTRGAAVRSVGAAVGAVRVKGVFLSVDVDPQ
jgi:primosomal protein N' (replication factor Y)